MEARYTLLKDPDEPSVKDKRRRRAALWTALILLPALALWSTQLLSLPRAYTPSIGDTDIVRQCPSSAVPAARPPAPTNPWAPLEAREISEVRRWLKAPERGLNLTAGAPQMSDNIVYLIEAWPPSKAGASSSPSRQAV